MSDASAITPTAAPTAALLAIVDPPCGWCHAAAFESVSGAPTRTRPAA